MTGPGDNRHKRKEVALDKASFLLAVCVYYLIASVDRPIEDHRSSWILVPWSVKGEIESRTIAEQLIAIGMQQIG